MRKIREIIWQNIIGDKVREIYGSQEIADEALRRRVPTRRNGLRTTASIRTEVGNEYLHGDY